MTKAIKQFLEADALRTQGEWLQENEAVFVPTKGQTPQCVLGYIAEGLYEPDATFIAAASRIAPEIRQLQSSLTIRTACYESANQRAEQLAETLKQVQDAFEQVCANLDELESMNDTSFVNDDEFAYHRQWVTEALAIAAPYRKGGA